MKKRCCILLALCLMLSLFTGCDQERQNQVYSEVMADIHEEASGEDAESSQARVSSQSGVPELSGELTINTIYGDDAYTVVAKMFEKAHPGVKVHIESVIPSMKDESGSQAIETYLKQTTVGLMSGTTGDLVNVGLMAYQKYGPSGLFEDFYSWMEKDPDFVKEDYYTNVFQALEVTEKLYVFPRSITYYALIFNGYMASKYGVDVKERFPDGVDHQGAVELFREMREAGIATEETFFSEGQNPLFFDQYEYPAYVDYNNASASFGSPDFVKYLETVDSLPWEREISQGMLFNGGWPRFGIDDYFCYRYPLMMIDLGMADGESYADTTEAVMCRSVSGLYPFEAVEGLAMPVYGENRELAWEFIKFMVEERDFPEVLNPHDPNGSGVEFGIYLGGIPINRKNFRKLVLALHEKDEKLADKFDAYHLLLNAVNPVSTELHLQLQDIRESYHTNHLITAEECGKQMEERTNLFLRE